MFVKATMFSFVIAAMGCARVKITIHLATVADDESDGTQ